MAAQSFPGSGAGGQVNGNGNSSNNGGSNDVLSRIHEALQLVHSPYSSNDARRDAQRFLEEVKAIDEAPFHGYTLAADRSQSPVVRHYALSLLEHAIRHRWPSFSPSQTEALRGWVVELCQAVSPQDPLYLRNKMAQLWVETAKRCWAAEWMDMDRLLVDIWQGGSAVHQVLVLNVLEMLSDEIFVSDDAVVAMREKTLSKACVDIVAPAAVLADTFPNRETGPEVRCGDEGWLARVSRRINECVAGDVQSNEDLRNIALRGLSLFLSMMPWSIPKAIAAAECVPAMCRALASSHVSVQKAALDAFYALYSRPYFRDDEFKDLVQPMFNRDGVELYGKLFEWSRVDAEDIDDDKYQFSKKLSEVLSCLGNYLDREFMTLTESEADIEGFINLLLRVVQSPSLVVSIPVLVAWVRVLNNSDFGRLAADSHVVPALLELCSSRLIRYESLPEDTRDQTYLFLIEDTDTVPERHAFLGNYRRYSCQVLEAIVGLKPSDVIYHILGQLENMLQPLYDGQSPVDVANYNKESLTILRLDAQFTMIESALKAYVRWKSVTQPTSEVAEQIKTDTTNMEAWCNKLLQMNIEDPMIRKKILQLLGVMSTTVLENDRNFLLRVLEHILMTWPALRPEHKAYNDAVKDLQAESVIELQRMAAKVPNQLLQVYDQIEARVTEMMSTGTLDEKRQMGYQTFLFIIIHRSSVLDQETRLQRLGQFIEPIKNQWQNPQLKSSLETYPGFCQLVALDKAQRYLASHRVHEIRDWGSCELDAEGLALQAEIEERQKLLPLRSTKTFLSFSVDKLDKEKAAFQTSYALWQGSFPLILPDLLQFLSHAHQSHDPNSWSELPPEMRHIVGRVLSDRFWQAGISEGSKEEFYARVMDRKGTLEGLASTIRGSIRFVRETCYAIFYCMALFDMQFYGFSELPQPLAHALFANSFYLSTHQQINLLNLVRYLVDDCPVELREHFLPPLLATCFQQMDAKINQEWAKLDQQQSVEAAGEALTEEMKAESILRQLTYTAVLLVADFLDPTKHNSPVMNPESNPDGTGWRRYPSLRKFCLMHSAIAEPMLLFATHAIRMRDSRCCSIILRVFRSIVPDMCTTAEEMSKAEAATSVPPPPSSSKDESNGTPGENRFPSTKDVGSYTDKLPLAPEVAGVLREYVSSEVLRACVASFHEPYFVDLQKELAQLMASIVVYYGPLTETPREVLLSLPRVRATDVDRLNEFMARPGQHLRQQRALVMDILREIKGVSIAEMGKMPSSAPGFGRGGESGGNKKAARSKMAQEFMTSDKEKGDKNGVVVGGQGNGGKREGGSPDGLEGVADLFNG